MAFYPANDRPAIHSIFVSTLRLSMGSYLSWVNANRPASNYRSLSFPA
jgi:hypothetical protein